MSRRPDSPAQLVRRWARVEQQIEQNCHWLMCQGSIAARRTGARRVWLLRFFVEVDGRRIQRSIYIGGDDQPELVQRARELIEHLRLIGRCDRQIVEDARAVKAVAIEMRHICQELSPRRKP